MQNKDQNESKTNEIDQLTQFDVEGSDILYQLSQKIKA